MNGLIQYIPMLERDVCLLTILWKVSTIFGHPWWLRGKESACNAGDLGSIPGSGRSPGEGNGNPLQILAWEIPWIEEPGGVTKESGMT